MKKRVLAQVAFLVLFLGLSIVTFPKTKNLSNSLSGVGSEEDNFSVSGIYDLIHVTGTIDGVGSIVINLKDANETIVFTAVSLGSEDIDFWIKIDVQFNANFHVIVEYLGDFSYDLSFRVSGGYWR